MALYPRGLESSAPLLQEPQILHEVEFGRIKNTYRVIKKDGRDLKPL